MRILYRSILFLIFMSCIGIDAGASEFPSWFGKLTHSKSEVIGYGVGDTYEQAFIRAKDEIAKTISTHITSESRMDQKLIDGDYSQNMDISIRETTDIVLDSVETVKQEHQGQLWYIALKYENLPFEIQFVNRLDHHTLAPETQNIYLSHTPLVRSLNREIGFQLDYKLIRKNGCWHLGYNDSMVLLNARNFERLFVNYSSKVFSLIPSSIKLTEGDVFTFKIQSSIDGYISLFNVCETGEVFIIENNRRVEAHGDAVIPDPSTDNELFAGLIEKGKWTFDLYLAVLDSEKMNLDRMNYAMETLDRLERNYKFDELLDFLNGHEFCSVVLSTKPKE